MKYRIIGLSIGCAAVAVWASSFSTIDPAQIDTEPTESPVTPAPSTRPLVDPAYDGERLANFIVSRSGPLDQTREENLPRSLEDIADPSSSIEALEGGQESNPDAREEALIDLYSSVSDATIATFVAALADVDLWVKDAAETGLYRHPNRPLVRQALTRMLTDESRDTRVTAAELLEEMGATDLQWDDLVRAPLPITPAVTCQEPKQN